MLNINRRTVIAVTLLRRRPALIEAARPGLIEARRTAI
jgi:hypothetical protein